MPEQPAPCRLCGQRPALECDRYNSGACWECYCQMRDEMAAAWLEHDALAEAAQAALDAHLDAAFVRRFESGVAS